MASLIDYPELAVQVRDIIEGTGRSMAFIKNNETPTDANKPWRTYETTPAQSVTAKAVEDDATSEDVPDSFNVRDGDKMLYVSALALGDTVDLTNFDAVIDNDERWSIVKVMPVKPGDVTLLYMAQVRR